MGLVRARAPTNTDTGAMIACTSSQNTHACRYESRTCIQANVTAVPTDRNPIDDVHAPAIATSRCGREESVLMSIHHRPSRGDQVVSRRSQNLHQRRCQPYEMPARGVEIADTSRRYQQEIPAGGDQQKPGVRRNQRVWLQDILLGERSDRFLQLCTT